MAWLDYFVFSNLINYGYAFLLIKLHTDKYRSYITIVMFSAFTGQEVSC